ncbi:hypothetical protein B0H10DRAFT_2215397 [Mycena sp. CBHHK59/15]|nr:hypothetical protein B0H10DRAFT_2215397 [Mycena sp. CBHHK59/15]
MPFSVKATYGRSGELRKLTFPSFPTYDQLYNQPQLLSFQTPLLSDSSKSSILIDREVHNAEQYNSCTAPYARGLPRGFVPDHTSPASLTGGGAPNPFIPASHIPPPPIILSTPQAHMDVDSSSSDHYSSSISSTLKPQHQHGPQSVAACNSAACCAVSQGKVEMEQMVSKFKDDLDRILKASFGTPAVSPLPVSPSFPNMMPLIPPSFCLFKYCTTCAKIFQGPWFACEKCSIVVCLGCHENQNTNFCVAAMGPHNMRKEACAACPADATGSVTPQVLPPGAWGWSPAPPLVHQSLWNTAPQGYSPAYPFGTPTPIPPFIPVRDLPRAPAPAAAALPVPAVAQTPEAPAPPAPPVIHRGVVCDMCDNVIEGIRHKCLDCPDYDLCTSCIASGSAERHNPFHEFLEIKEPGRVIVHTVYSGDGERDTAASNSGARAATAPAAEEQQDPAMHFATCNLCDSRIRGDRYKCADCPDFDTCSNCFSITREQHPHHAFRRENPVAPMHFVTCNACSKGIFGIRYKCMHPDCPDFDLCEGCEAFPIPVHPDNHPLLKMRSANTVVPTVYRVGQTALIERGRSPAPVLAQHTRSRSPSFERGFMMNPSARSNTLPTSFFDSAPSPIPPPSPFFFRSESSRSSSPVLAYQPPVQSPSPPRSYAVPPPVSSSPMMMPGGLYEEPTFVREARLFPYPHVYPLGRPQPTASRFSHSPSPSPPLFRNHSRSPSPPRPSRHATWAARELPRWSHYPAFPDQTRERQHGHEQQQRAAEAEADSMARERQQALDELAVAHRMLEQRLEQHQQQWTVPAPVSVLVPAAPEPVEPNGFPGYWLKSSEDLRHLMEVPAVEEGFSQLSLGGRSPRRRDGKAPVVSFNHSLAALLNGYESEDNELEYAKETAPKEDNELEPKAQVAPAPAPPAAAIGLRASFVNDLTLPDGQIFPPGAEFMKCWQMVNSGGVDWPASTELVFVAGETLAREHSGPQAVAIGSVKVGAEVDVWTGELKAPEVPGRYMSYWRLRDGHGNLFGDCIWIDINVTETSGSNESSLSSSSVIVMPNAAGQSAGASVAAQSGEIGSSWSRTRSRTGSSASSVSLISVPTSEDDDWAASRVAVAGVGEGQRYVVLYDDASSESSDEE